MINEHLLNEDHKIFRDAARRFIETEMLPHAAAWEEQGMVPRDVWRKAGAAGLLCCNVDETYGGPGGDFLFNVIVIEELARAGMSAAAFSVHTDMVAIYIERFASEFLKSKWLPEMVSGAAIGAVAMSEPDAGSDLRGIKTSARREGNEYVVNGQKTYISNGLNCDVVVLAVKTGGAQARDGISLFLAEADRPGFVKGRKLKKLGLHGQDTAELFFDNMRLPAENLIGEEGQGLPMLTKNLAFERLAVSIRALASVEVTLDQTTDFVRQRKAFGHALAEFQNTQFQLAELKTSAVIARAFLDQCVMAAQQQKLTSGDAAMAKLFCTELLGRTADQCLQLHGGAGYMWETPVCRLFADARVSRIAGGSSEIMKLIIAKEVLGLTGKRA